MAETQAATWTIGRLLQWTQGYFAEKGLEEPRLSSELLLASALGCRKIELYTRFDQTPAAGQVERFRELVREAAGHKPIAYLVGRKEFYSLEFLVTPDVLIPRPETELLVEQAVMALREGKREAATVWDIGTGSGCAAVAIAKLHPAARVVASDVSAAALAVARQNAERHGVLDRVTIVEADAAEIPAEVVPEGGFDILVSNPPYIAESHRATLPANIREHEPALALFGGADGLAVIRKIATGALANLVAGGRAFVEVADGQAEAAAAEFERSGWVHRDTLKDGAGIARVLRLGRGA